MTTPERDNGPLTDAEIAELKRWLDQSLVNDDTPEYSAWYVRRIVATIAAREKAARIAALTEALALSTNVGGDLDIEKLIEKERVKP
jgi:hypothetical protein